MANIIDLDDYLNGTGSESMNDLFTKDDDSDLLLRENPFPFKARKRQQFDNLQTSVGEKKTEKEKEEAKFVLNPVSIAISKNAKIKLENYLKKSPQFKIITNQINLLLAEMIVYKKAGEKEMYEKCEVLVKDLTENRKKFIRFYKNSDWKAINAESDEKVKNSEVLKELKERRKKLEKEFKMINPNSLMYQLKDMRAALKLSDKHDYEYNFDDPDEIEDLDDILDKKETSISIEQEYNNLCGHIADMIDMSPKEVREENLNVIYNKLKEYCDDDKISEISDELTQLKMDFSMEMNSLKGRNDITNIMFDIFDFNTVEEEKPKEMLGAANVEYVKMIAYEQCRKLNMLHLLDDSIANGLLGLSCALDSWYKIQKIKDSPISFAGFAHKSITLTIKKGFYELGNGGLMSKGAMSNMVFRQKQQFQNFLKLNPELKDLPTEVIEDLIDGLEGSRKSEFKGIYTESSINQTIGGEDEVGDSDAWVNSSKSNIYDETYAEAKNEFENLLKSLKQLFSLFETRIDRETGVKEVGYNRIFDKYDYKLFKLTYGLEFKKDSMSETATTVKTTYTQEEIRIIMQNMYRADGDTRKTFTQEAIADRKKRLDRKIKQALDDNPGLKAGLQSIMYYCAENSAAISTISNTLEDAEIANSRKELAQIYSGNSQKMNKKLIDGKRLSDDYQISSQNGFDDEIAQSFRTF